jgi:hypothetical protein
MKTATLSETDKVWETDVTKWQTGGVLVCRFCFGTQFAL